MPNRRKHIITGQAASLAYSAIRSQGELPLSRILESLGGVIGGGIGGCIPDIIEPAASPGHRDIAHSFAAIAALFALADRKLQSVQQILRDEAKAMAARRDNCGEGSIEAIFLSLAEAF
jgi:hypothetical protein